MNQRTSKTALRSKSERRTPKRSPLFSRRHYAAIAAILHQVKIHLRANEMYMFSYTVSEFVNEFAADNKNFDEEKFLKDIEEGA